MRMRVPVKTEAMMISELYPLTFDASKTKQKSPERDAATTPLTAGLSMTHSYHKKTYLR